MKGLVILAFLPLFFTASASPKLMIKSDKNFGCTPTLFYPTDKYELTLNIKNSVPFAKIHIDNFEHSMTDRRGDFRKTFMSISRGCHHLKLEKGNFSINHLFEVLGPSELNCTGKSQANFNCSLSKYNN